MYEDNIKITTTLDMALMELVHRERLSREAGIEEFCKILLVKLCYERKNQMVMSYSDVNIGLFEESIDKLYSGLFISYVTPVSFKGWEHLDVKLKTFGEVVKLLMDINFAALDEVTVGREFTMFLQAHFGWYANDYSTPTSLTNYIFKVLDVKTMKSIYDPCSGIGGMLATAYDNRGEHLKISGNDIRQTMVNITRLHLKFYGYTGDYFTCFDYTEKNRNEYVKLYDCIVAQIPTRRQAFSIAGRVNNGYGEEFMDTDLEFVKNILGQLEEGGVAAIVVSDSVVEDHKKRFVRDYISSNAELLNITKFTDVVAKNNYHKKSYYILFLRNFYERRFCGKCSVTLFGEETSKEDREDAASWVKKYISGDMSLAENALCKKFSYWNMTNWNISLLFIRDRIGKEFEAVTLGDILSLRRNKVEIEPNKEYQELRVRRRGKGIDVKRVYQGEVIHENMYLASANDLMVSSFEADMGGMGYVPKELDGCVVTKNIYLYRVNKERVDENYLMMVLNSDPVLEQLQEMNDRTHILSRISMAKFLSVVIPLPDLKTQRVLAKDLQRYVDKVNKAEAEQDEAKKSFNKKVFGRE